MRQKGFAAILVILVIAVIGIGAFYYWYQDQTPLNNQNQETPVSTSADFRSVEPTFTNNRKKLTSPIIYLTHTNIKFDSNKEKAKLELDLTENWNFGSYDFTYCELEKSVCAYSVKAVHTKNPEYTVNFARLDTSFGACDFDKVLEEDVWNEDMDLYKTISTDFGILRIGKTTGDRFEVCQYDSERKNWIDVTKIGFITISSPKNYDSTIIDEMINIIKNIKYN